MILRAAIAVACAAIMAVQVIRNAAVTALAAAQPAAAAQLWSGHPATELSLAMTDIALAARGGHVAPPSAYALMSDAAAKDPLAPEPFLVRGVQAQFAGDGAMAQRAFEAAQWRDPRSLPAAYFLAERYFGIGDVGRGLRQVAALARLSPNGSTAVGPYLAQYAANPNNWAALRPMLGANPFLAQPVLATLASD